MEEGSLRCEPNVSVRPIGSDQFGTKTEIKNLNSFRSVFKGIEFETKRQAELLERGERIHQETRGWNDTKQITFSQRSKEGEAEYRYFPEPDLVPLEISDEWIEEIRRTMPELPEARLARFVSEYGLPEYDAAFLTETRALADYFENTAKLCGDPKSASNWIMGDLAKLLNAESKDITASRISPNNLSGMLNLIADGTISGKIAKSVLEEMYSTGGDPAEIVEAHGWKTIKDTGAVMAIVDKVFTANPIVVEAVVAAIRDNAPTGKKGFLVGQVMRETQGKADPGEVNRLIDEKLAAMA